MVQSYNRGFNPSSQSYSMLAQGINPYMQAIQSANKMSMTGMLPGSGYGDAQQAIQDQKVGVPPLPSSVQQILQDRQRRTSLEGNPLMALAANPAPTPPMGMQGFQPSTLPMTGNDWEQRTEPSEAERSRSMQSDMGSMGMRPQQSGPQIPRNMNGMGLGANAPQQYGGGSQPGGGMGDISKSLQGIKNAYQQGQPGGGIDQKWGYNPDQQGGMMGGQQGNQPGYEGSQYPQYQGGMQKYQGGMQQPPMMDPTSYLQDQLYNQYLNLYPEGNLDFGGGGFGDFGGGFYD
jgi:hypothetical protein